MKRSGFPVIAALLAANSRGSELHDRGDPVLRAAVLRRHCLLVVGLSYKIADYARTPAPLKIPTTPAPTTTGGVVLRMPREVTLFESLFKSNKWIWLFGYMFHVALALVLLRHLRYFTEPVWFWVIWSSRSASTPALPWWPGWRPVGAPLPGGPGALYLHAIGSPDAGAADRRSASTGLSMKFVAHTDIISVKEFILGLMLFDLQPLPVQPGAARASDAGGAADDDFPDQQAVACARPVLQPDAQPDRRFARAAASRALGRRTGKSEIA